jgi:hypothetical protein
MKKILLILLIVLNTTIVVGQCTVAVSSFSANFDSNTNNLLPTCWTTPYTNGGAEVGVNINGQGAGGSVGYIYVSNSIGDPRHFIMPKVTNANGVLTLTAKRAVSANATTMEIGIMTDPNNVSTFSVMATYNLGTSYAGYNVNLASYIGTGQYIGIRTYFTNYVPLDAPTTAWIDNISYNSFSGTGSAIYVDKDATGSNNGTSWANAYTDLNNALQNTTFNLGEEIWIAEGIYKPHISNRLISFVLPHNARIYGGFAGTETLKTQRNPKLNIVTLSGDLSGNDNNVIDPSEATRQENSYHILTVAGEARDIEIDGVTISGANANGTGNEVTAGVIMMTHIAANNIISVSFSDIIIENNTGTNAAIFQALQYYTQPSTSILNMSKCTIRNNKANGNAGNILYVGHRTNNQKTIGTITNSLFYKNTSVAGAATIYNKVNGGDGVVTPIVVRNCTFSNNNGVSGRVLNVSNSGDSKYVNNIFYGNGSTTPIFFNSGSIPTVFTNCIAEDPVFGINQDPLFTDAANDNYTLDCSGNSPAINAGNSLGISALELDYAGNPRLIGTVDIGAYEYKNRISISSTSTVICLGNSVTLTANYGTGLNWSNGVVNGAAFSPTATLTYTVTGVNENLCPDQATVTITVETNPTVTVNSGSICRGSSFTITPSGASTYTIQGGSAVITPTTNSTYTVVGTSSAGCLSNNFATSIITVNANPTITVNSGSICPGQSFTFTPSGANTYTIQGGNSVVTPSSNSTYTVTGTNTNGCSAQTLATSTITIKPTPTITVNGGTICSGNTFTIVPSGANTYTFSGGSSIVSPTINTSYTVTGTGINGCSNLVGSISAVVVTPAILNLSVTAAQANVCSGQSTSITTNTSESGIKYTLRDNSNNTIISGPTFGNGSALSFTTGPLSSTTTYNLYAERVNNPYALSFDGVNDYVNAPTSSLNYNAGYTYEAWLKSTLPGSSGSRCIFFTGTNTQTDIEIYVQGTSNKLVVVYNRYKSGVTTSGGVYTVPPNNIWYHLAVTYDGTTTKVYFNGVLQTLTQAVTGNALQKTTAAQLSLGYHKAAGISHPTDGFITYQGNMDDVRLWNTTRTQSEIQNNMNSCSIASSSGLSNYYSFDEGTGAIAVDAISGNDGTLTNMTPSSNWIAGYLNCASTGCSVEMNQYPTVTVNLPPIISVNSGSICSGNSFTITPSGANTYTIQGGNSVKTPTANASYTVVGTSSAGCISSTFATSNVTVNSTPTISVNNGNICMGNSFTITPNGANTYTIQGGSSVKTPTASTSYTVIGTSNAGCTASTFATSSVTVNALPAVVATSSNSFLCIGQTATLTASGASTYSWNPGGNGTIISVTPTLTTTYTVTGTDANGCKNSTTLTQDVSLCTGVVQLVNNSNSVSIFPNPSTSYITITSINDITSILIFNSLGALVQTEETNSFSVAQLPNGIYFAEIQTKNGTTAKRFVKQ